MNPSRLTIVVATVASLGLAGCVTIDNRAAPTAAACREGSGQEFLGQKASAEIGSAILKATGAKTLRWGAPGAVFTMDLRPDRVNVLYDGAMIITSVKCG